MGNIFNKVLSKLFKQKEPKRIVMIGLDAAGKTTITYKLKLGENINAIPTIGFNVETIKINNMKMNIWDLGAQSKIIELWPHYYKEADCLIYVVDSSDRRRLKTAKELVWKAIEDEDLKDVPILIFANKQDLGVMNTQEIVSGLGLEELKGRPWYVQGCSAISGDGLFEGFEWVSKQIGDK